MNVRSPDIITVPLLDSYGEPDEPAAGRHTAAEPEPGHVPDSAALTRELERLDDELLRLIRRRTELARAVVSRRIAEGGTAYVHEQELAVARRFRVLGPSGPDLALLLLRQAR
ncbi:chorismate mutase [Actinoplanes sp. NPDC048791]|uniref:chorismate mutase n=1 Tax=Actinoplanes sp. NPDC048791 TaxID=3154623 RepID=UPI0033D3387F